MRTRLIVALAAALLCVSAIAGIALATAPTGVTTTAFAIGHFNEIDAKTLGSSWQARIGTKGLSDFYVLENRIVPGRSFGWHSHRAEPRRRQVRRPHPVPGDDPTCTPEVVPAGPGSWTTAATSTSSGMRAVSTPWCT